MVWDLFCVARTEDLALFVADGFLQLSIYTSRRDSASSNQFWPFHLKLLLAKVPIEVPFARLRPSSEHGFLIKRGLPGFNVVVSDMFRAGPDCIDREFVEYSEYACGDAVANACKMTQALAR